MGIKPQAENAFFSKHPDQKQVALAFDECFTITHGKEFGGFFYWVAEPRKHVRERFGLTKEILMLYSPFDRVDQRAFKAVEDLVSGPVLRNRVDNLVSILVHNGNPHDAADLAREKNVRVVVPFACAELHDKNAGVLFVQSRLAKELGATDLFGMSSPLKSDVYFFGRDDLVQELVDRATVRGENSGVFGLRKTGKTSVLYALKRRVESRPILVEYFDCQNPGLQGARWWQALENLVDRLDASLKTNYKRSGKPRLNYRPESAGTAFSADIQGLLANGGLDKIIVLLDEIEWISPKLSGALGKHWDVDFVPFWQAVRATHQETQGRLTFVVAGVNPMAVETPHFDTLPNPIFQLARPYFLQPLAQQVIREMLSVIGRYAGVQFDPAVFGHVHKMYGGHPYIVRIACSEVVSRIDTTNPQYMARVCVDDFAVAAADISERLAQPIKDILLSLVWWYPEEYDLLRITAAGDTAFVEQYATERGGHMQFHKYGILKDGTTEFAIADMKTFLQHYGDMYKKELSPFTRSDFPPELLPEIPDIELLGELFILRTNLEVQLRRLVITMLNFAKGFDGTKVAFAMIGGLVKRPDRSDPGALFVGRRPQDVIHDLYLLDLKTIVANNWDVFSGLFDNDKGQFELSMDRLNKARRVDGHSKPITVEEAGAIKDSFSWLKLKLAKVP